MSRQNTYQTLSKENIYLAIGSAFGLGLSPIAPGTFGTILGVLIHVVIVFFLPSNTQLITLIVIFALVCLANHVLTPWAEEYWQSEDPSHFVLDEVAGYLLIPILFRQGGIWPVALWGFLLFRLFDITKVPPARQIDRNVHGPWGILLDDLVSAGYAVMVMYFLRWISLRFGIEGSWLLGSV